MTNYFKFLNFYALAFLTTIIPGILSSQEGPDVPQTDRVLCYSTTTREVQKLSSTVNYSEIQTHELLRTKVITYKKAFQVSLDDFDNYITKYRYLYHKNLFPDWHIAPDETIIDNVGTRQVFSTTSTVYKGGWFGSQYEVKRTGAYTTMDLRHGYPEYSYHVDYTTDEMKEYLETKQTIVENGLTFPLKFLIPNKEQITEYQNNGYTVIETAEWIKIFNRDITLTYYITEKKIVYELYNEYTLVYKVEKFYEWFTEVGQDLIVKEIAIQPYVLSTGDCAESISTTLYEDYNFGCDEESMEIRQKEALDASKSLTVFPNPANDFVNLHLNINFNETDKVEIIVYNQLGSVVIANTSVGRLQSTLNVESLRSGLYHITVQVNNNFYSSTFNKN
jgi:hypothetical protein